MWAPCNVSDACVCVSLCVASMFFKTDEPVQKQRSGLSAGYL
jgi:hypothetical protein